MEYSKFIRFLNANDTCCPGEVLKGEVVLTLDKPKKYKGMYNHIRREGRYRCAHTELSISQPLIANVNYIDMALSGNLITLISCPLMVFIVSTLCCTI